VRRWLHLLLTASPGRSAILGRMGEENEMMSSRNTPSAPAVEASRRVSRVRTIVGWWDRHQVPLYVAAIILGGLISSLAPRIAPALTVTINPALALILFATFLEVPLIEVGRSFRDIRFLGTVLIVNFIIVPLIVFVLSRFVADDRGLLLGVLLVLLTPCIDYVIVFTGLAGGAKARLLAAAPLLMLLQIVLLPPYLLLFAGSDAVELIEIEPFVEAFLILIVAPLVAAAIVQAIARQHRAGRAIEAVMAAAMVPLMMLTLAVVIGSQIAAVGGQAVTLIRAVPIYVAFLAVMLFVGLAAGRLARLEVPATRALMFSGSTRNSLVVLPLALALPASLSIAPLAVVTQTLVELVGMVIFVRVVPSLTSRRAVDGGRIAP
jgi:ACR3 family arsenite efflux pump ArsB